MKNVVKQVLSFVLILSLLIGVTILPADAGTVATYPAGQQYVNADGWALQRFAIEGDTIYAVRGYVGMPLLLHLESIWQRSGDVLEHSISDREIAIPAGIFTWKIDDESIAQIIPGQVVEDNPQIAPNAYIDGTNAIFYCLKEGRTTITVTGPNGKTSKTNLVVWPSGEPPAPSEFGSSMYQLVGDVFEEDSWTLLSFFLHLNGDMLNSTIGMGETSALQIESSWWRVNPDLGEIGKTETLKGYLNLGADAFTWRVSDESVAVLKDDYPGTNTRSLVGLREGYVDVLVTGPFGKWTNHRVYVLPVNEFPNNPDPDPDPNPGPTPNPNPGSGDGSWWDEISEWMKEFNAKKGLVTGITLQPSAMTLYPGEMKTATAVIIPYNAANRNVSFSSSNPDVATVSAYGQVTAVAPGTAMITATAQDGSGKSGTCTVTVKQRLVTSISLDINDLTMQEGTTSQITAAVKPDNAADKRVTWRSANPAIAAVDQNTGVVTAKKAGTTTISCTAMDGSGVKANCTVRVVAPNVPDTDSIFGPLTGEEPGELAVGLDDDGSDRNIIARIFDWLDGLTNLISGKRASKVEIYQNGSKRDLSNPIHIYAGYSKTLSFKPDPVNGTYKFVKWDISSGTSAIVNQSRVLTGGSSYGECNVKVTLSDGSLALFQPSATAKVFTIDKLATPLSSKTIKATNIYGGPSISYIASSVPANKTVSIEGTYGDDWYYVNYGDWWKFARKSDLGAVSIPVTGVSLNKSNLSLAVGATSTLKETVSPSGATNKSVTWLSNNTAVATVSNDGKVTAKAAGTATITVKTNDGGYTATCRVTVSNISVTGVTVKNGATVLGPKTPLLIYINDSKSLTVTVEPSNATDKSYNWSTPPNSSVATRNGSTFKGIKEDTTSSAVKTTSGGKTVEFDIVVLTHMSSIPAKMIGSQGLWNGPSTKYKNIKNLSINQAVTICGSYGAFYYIKAGNDYGFVAKGNVGILIYQTRKGRTTNENGTLAEDLNNLNLSKASIMNVSSQFKDMTIPLTPPTQAAAYP